ncbi:MAG: helix-turn-helix domain-containing protein [Holophagales bacterium]|nr:helix-turn-helix domain-containing protein [Holophagales bacterium]
MITQTTPGQRLTILRESLGLSYREFASPLDVSHSTVRRWEIGKKEVDRAVVLNVSDYYKASIDWLLTGKGEMMVGDKANMVAESVTPHVAADGEYLNIRLVDMKASAGHGSIVELEPLSTAYLLFGRQWLHERIGIAHERLVVLSVDGDSMTPTLSPNDLIMIDTSAIERGFKDGIWLFSMDNAVHIKRVSHRGRGQFVASSDNKEYQPFTLEEPYHFIGRLVWSDKRW